MFSSIIVFSGIVASDPSPVPPSSPQSQQRQLEKERMGNI